MPIFILTRHDPDDMRQWLLVTCVNGVTSAMTQAKEAAGDKNVLVHGAGTAQLTLAASVLDELEMHLNPVLFGQGRRLLLFAIRGERQPPRLSAIFRSASKLSGKEGPAHALDPPRRNCRGIIVG